MNEEQRRALALSGVFQAAVVVDEFARTGHYNQQAWETLVHATVEPNPASFEAIYGHDIAHLSTGIQTASKLLESNNPSSEVTRYAMSILMLAHRMRRDPAMLDTLSERLERIHQQAEHFGPTHENVILALGELYQNTLSTLRYRIVVHGNPNLMSSAHMADRIRAILLTGIRFAVLWRHEGGRRWQLLLARKQIKQSLLSLPS